MNETKLCNDLDVLMHFIDDSLGIDKERNSVSGFYLSVTITESAAYNSYLKSVSNKTDTLYLRCRESLISMMTYAYL